MTESSESSAAAAGAAFFSLRGEAERRGGIAARLPEGQGVPCETSVSREKSSAVRARPRRAAGGGAGNSFEDEPAHRSLPACG